MTAARVNLRGEVLQTSPHFILTKTCDVGVTTPVFSGEEREVTGPGARGARVGPEAELGPSDAQALPGALCPMHPAWHGEMCLLTALSQLPSNHRAVRSLVPADGPPPLLKGGVWAQQG